MCSKCMDSEKRMKTQETQVNPKAWKHCVAWSFIAGRNHACFEMCTEQQRDACCKNQLEQKNKRTKENEET